MALVPELVPRLAALGCAVAVQRGAGEAADHPDDEYERAGAVVLDDPFTDADVVLSVRPPDEDVVRRLAPGAAAISFLEPERSTALVASLRDREVASFALELVPRLSRAQSMDALTSQALVTGYRGAVVAAEMLRRFFGVHMTAAGTVPAAQVLVLGTGVAGLQAIATCVRLGAVVRAYDVRASSAEEIASLGAEPLDLGLEPLTGAAGYARDMDAERAARQQALLAPYVAAADVLITTASVPGRPAPVLVTRSMVERMSPGSVVVDLATEAGGNVAGVVAGEVVRIGQARVWGAADVASQLPGTASRLLAHNVVSLVAHLTATDGDGARFAPDLDDEIVAGCCVTLGGRILHGPTREAVQSLERGR